nr:M23 family metallopeptidase [uncultured Dysosmobacter sp.]
MTSRQAGRRMATVAAERHGSRSRARRKTAPPKKQETPAAARERRQLIQLVVCGTVFVLLVAAKLLLPDRMARINEAISRAMEQNVDVQAVFSAVGRAFSGEEGAAEEVYRAVFRPETAVETAAQIRMGTTSRALETLEDCLPAGEEPAEQTPETSNLAYVLYSSQNVPENVSMEQAILNFDYCAPVIGTMSSDFGYRDHPVEGEERFHYGVDLAADTGTEILCFADGTVTAVGESNSYGKYCMVDHPGGYATLYAHCSRITAASGTAVRRGQKIAEVGETGMATGPHLHFELRHQGTYLNPIYYVA